MTETLPFTKGQKIKLNAKGLRVFHSNNGGTQHPTRFSDWPSRIGIIVSITDKGARIIWEGNKTKSDILSATCLESA